MANVYIKTFGCALNQSDSETMVGVLEKEGHVVVSDEKNADAVIINSCTVKDEAENKLYKEIRRHKNRRIIIAGCVAQADRKLAETKLKDYSVIGTSQLSNIGTVLNDALLGKRSVLLDKPNKGKEERITLPRVRKNERVSIIPINEGCRGSCTFCKTKQARGKLYSYRKKEIISEIKKSVESGAKEVWLTSQDTGAYGLDIDDSLPRLLNEILKIEGDFMVRLGMCNPEYGVMYLKELKKILKHEKMFRFIHLPLQSGSNCVLKGMKREYSKEEFLKVARELKKAIPDLTLATDIIVGFPGETEKDFEETMEVVRELEPDVINMSRFWKRPGTPAAKMKQIDSKIIKQRSIRLRELFHKISVERNKRWIGWSGRIIFEEEGKNDTLVGRNYAFKPIVVKKEKGLILNDESMVKITSSTMWDLRGEVIFRRLIRK